MRDTAHSVFRSASRFFSGTIISRALGLLRDMAMAASFGITPSIAAFMLAFRLSHFSRRIFGEGAMAAAFAPHYEGLAKEKAKEFFVSLFVAIFLFLSLGCTVAGLILLAIGGEALTLTALMLPSLVFICLYGITNSFLQCEGSFFKGAAAPAAFNLIWILGVYLLYQYPEETAVRGLAWTVNLACLVQWLFIAPAAWKALKPLPRKIDLRAILPFFAPFATILLGTAAQQINNAVDPLFAVAADPEGPALLWYALRLEQLPLALFGIALANALLPPLSRAQANGEKERGRALLLYSLKQCFDLMLPITLFYLLFSHSLIRLMFQRGDFTAEATAATASCLSGYALALLPGALVLLLSSAFFARKENRVPLRGSLLSVGANLILNGICVFGFGLGAASVAYATAAASWVNLGYLLYHERAIPEGLPLSFALSGAAALLSLALPEPLGYLPLALVALQPLRTLRTVSPRIAPTTPLRHDWEGR